MSSSVSRSGRRPSLRQRVYEVVAPYEEGTRYPRLSLWTDIVILLCIVASCVLVPLEHYLPEHGPTLVTIELIFTGIFVVEYLLRWYSAPNRLSYPLTFYAVIDLLAILPTLLMLGVEMILLRSLRAIRLLRMLRLLRLLRLLKFLRHGYLIHCALIDTRVWLSALNHTYHLYRLGRLCVWLLVAWFVGANAVYLTEINLGGASGPFGDYWRSYWHIIIVLISGIEDKEPISLLGRVEVTVLMFAGICMVGMLTGEIVSILVRRMQRAGKVAILPPGSQVAEHVLILGANRHLDHVIEQIHASLGDQHFIVIVHPGATERPAPAPALYRKVFALSGNPVEPRVLEEAGVDEALRVIVLSPDAEEGAERGRGEADPKRLDGRALMETLAVTSRNRRVPLVVQLQADESLPGAGNLAGVEIVLPRRYGEKLIAQAVMNPGVTEIYDDLLTFESSAEIYVVPVPPELIGQSYGALQLFCLERDEPIVALGIDRSPPERPLSRFWLNPAGTLSPEELVLREGDLAVVIANERPAFIEIDKEEMWSGRVIPGT